MSGLLINSTSCLSLYLTSLFSFKSVRYHLFKNFIIHLKLFISHIDKTKKPTITQGQKINFDKILHVSEDGKTISSWSTFDNLESLKKLHLPSLFDIEEKITKDTTERYKYFLLAKFNLEKIRFLDYYHANAVEVLPETQLGKKDRRFQEGNRLACFRNADLITIIDKETGKIIWSWGPGKISLPHTPTMLDNGNILIFDSQGNGGYSRVIELDPISEEIVWEYKGDPPETFFSRRKGSAQRLPNGNTLITDSDHGRVLEVTREGKTVWEWLNPETDIEDQLRKSVYRMRRLNKDAVEKLFQTLCPKHLRKNVDVVSASNNPKHGFEAVEGLISVFSGLGTWVPIIPNHKFPGILQGITTVIININCYSYIFPFIELF